MEQSRPNNLPPMPCYYCKTRPAEKDETANIDMYGNVKRAFKKVEYQRTTCSVPRCRRCKRVHTQVGFSIIISILLMLILGVWIDFAIVPSAYVVFGLLVAFLIAAVVGGILGDKFGTVIFLRSKQTLAFSDIASFPPADRLLKEGWTLSRPTP